eukprot:jgi/Bigna1/67244/fgenesh1_pg.3_\
MVSPRLLLPLLCTWLALAAIERGGSKSLEVNERVSSRSNATQDALVGYSAGDLIVSPKGKSFSAVTISIAIQVIKNEKMPAIDDASIAVLKENIKDPTSFVACHDTANQLLHIMGEGTVAKTGGKGKELNVEACDAAIQVLESGVPSAIQITGRSIGADGHSFVLILKDNQKVDVLEAWAVAGGHQAASLPALLRQCKKNIPVADAIQALTEMKSPDTNVRTRGYTALSTAYPTAVYYELNADESTHAPVGERIIVVHSRKLAPASHIEEKMLKRCELALELEEKVKAASTSDVQAQQEKLLDKNIPCKPYFHIEHRLQGENEIWAKRVEWLTSGIPEDHEDREDMVDDLMMEAWIYASEMTRPSLRKDMSLDKYCIKKAAEYMKDQGYPQKGKLSTDLTPE